MENDPNKKESKGKRIFKKALRRISRSSNSGQSSTLEQGGVSRSKSFENQRLAVRISDSTPLLARDGTAADTADREPAAHKAKTDGKLIANQDGLSDFVKEKKVEIHESHNKTIGEAATIPEINETGAVSKEQRASAQGGTKRNLKRKLDEDSGAGTSGASAGTSDNEPDDKDPSKDKKKKNRCAVCRKKVGLTGFECRCGGLFCAVHRYSDKHECSFDYRELGAQEIRRNNPVVVSQKIHKI